MTEINFNLIDKDFDIIQMDNLVQGSTDINILKVWFGTYINSVFTPDLTIAEDKSKVVGVIYTRPDGKHTWFINFAPQLDGSFLTTISSWALFLAGTLFLDVQIKTLTTGVNDSYNRVSLLVNQGTALDNEEFVFTQADYDNIWDTIRKIEVNADADLMIGTVNALVDSLPLSGFRTVDGVNLIDNDQVLVIGQGELNGIYIVHENEWELFQEIYENRIVSIDTGENYGGSMLKKLENGTFKMVKKPERLKWRTI